MTKAPICDLSQNYNVLKCDMKFLYIAIEILISERLIPVGQGGLIMSYEERIIEDVRFQK